MRIHRANVGLLTGYRSPAAWHLLARITGATSRDAFGSPRILTRGWHCSARVPAL